MEYPIKECLFMHTASAVKAFAAIAHEGRLELLRRLIELGPEGAWAGDLATHAGIGATTASAQLGVLANAGLVSAQRIGRGVRYRADFAALSSLLDFLCQDCCGGRQDICGVVAQALESA